MRYAKLNEGQLEVAPSILVIKKVQYINPTDAMYKQCGYMPYDDSYPEDGKTYECAGYEEQDGKIVNVWTEIDPKPTIDDVVEALDMLTNIVLGE